jgi:plasmid stabilization system protein ParE
MNVRKTDVFLADVERQYEWYVAHADWEVADRYLDAVEGSCRLLSQQPNLGPSGGFAHPEIRAWRFFLILRPFSRHIVFYEIIAEEVVLRRAIHGHRDLPRRLLETLGG